MASSLEFNKVAAAVLAAGVVAMATGFVAELLFHPTELENHAYVVESEGEEMVEAAVTEAPMEESLLGLMAAADVAAGEKVWKKCKSCHDLSKGGPHKIGPNLYDIVNRSIAGAEGFGYSSALQEMSAETWTYENLGAFLSKPKDWAPGTKMAFPGLKSVAQRADLIAYLRSQSDNPAAMPE